MKTSFARDNLDDGVQTVLTHFLAEAPGLGEDEYPRFVERLCDRARYEISRKKRPISESALSTPGAEDELRIEHFASETTPADQDEMNQFRLRLIRSIVRQRFLSTVFESAMLRHGLRMYLTGRTEKGILRQLGYDKPGLLREIILQFEANCRADLRAVGFEVDGISLSGLYGPPSGYRFTKNRTFNFNVDWIIDHILMVVNGTNPPTLKSIDAKVRTANNELEQPDRTVAKKIWGLVSEGQIPPDELAQSPYLNRIEAFVHDRLTASETLPARTQNAVVRKMNRFETLKLQLKEEFPEADDLEIGQAIEFQINQFDEPRRTRARVAFHASMLKTVEQPLNMTAKQINTLLIGATLTIVNQIRHSPEWRGRYGSEIPKEQGNILFSFDRAWLTDVLAKFHPRADARELEMFVERGFAELEKEDQEMAWQLWAGTPPALVKTPSGKTLPENRPGKLRNKVHLRLAALGMVPKIQQALNISKPTPRMKLIASLKTFFGTQYETEIEATIDSMAAEDRESGFLFAALRSETLAEAGKLFGKTKNESWNYFRNFAEWVGQRLDDTLSVDLDSITCLDQPDGFFQFARNWQQSHILAYTPMEQEKLNEVIFEILRELPVNEGAVGTLMQLRGSRYVSMAQRAEVLKPGDKMPNTKDIRIKIHRRLATRGLLPPLHFEQGSVVLGSRTIDLSLLPENEEDEWDE